MEKSTFKEFFMNKIFSRKMVVWIVACLMLCFKFISQDTWLIISISYMGINAALTAIDSIKTAKKEIVEQTVASVEQPKEGET